MKLAYCPACGAAEKPVLVVTPFYACPDCETVTPREQLEFKRKNHYVLAGTGGPVPITVVALGTQTMFDGTAATNNITTTALNFLAGDYVVVSIVTYGGDEATLRPDINLAGSLAVVNADASAGGSSDVYAAIFSFRNATAGAKTVAANFLGSFNPVSAAMTVTVLRSNGLIRPDAAKATYSSSGGTLCTSGTLPDNIADNEIAFAVAASQNRSSATPASWVSPGNRFTTLHRAGTDTGVNDCTVETATLRPALSPTIARATIPAANNVGIAVTYRNQ